MGQILDCFYVWDNHDNTDLRWREKIRVAQWIFVQPFKPYNAEILSYKPWGPMCFFQFEIIINVLVSSFRSIWVLRYEFTAIINICFLTVRGSTLFRRPNLTSDSDVWSRSPRCKGQEWNECLNKFGLIILNKYVYFSPLEVVARGSETQPQAGEK